MKRERGRQKLYAASYPLTGMQTVFLHQFRKVHSYLAKNKIYDLYLYRLVSSMCQVGLFYFLFQSLSEKQKDLQFKICNVQVNGCSYKIVLCSIVVWQSFLLFDSCMKDDMTKGPHSASTIFMLWTAFLCSVSDMCLFCQTNRYACCYYCKLLQL